MSIRSLCRSALLALFVSLSNPLDAHALSNQLSFGTCGSEAPEDMQACCRRGYEECTARCDEDFQDFGKRSSCRWNCVEAHEVCKGGTPLMTTLGASSGNGVVLQSVGSSAVPASGLQLMPSSGAVLAELRSSSDPNACSAVVIACRCPAGAEAMGQDCRAWLYDGATSCTICKQGAPDSTCAPCPTCRSEVLSAQACSAKEQPQPAATSRMPAMRR
jgi:hypothetical protein